MSIIQQKLSQDARKTDFRSAELNLSPRVASQCIIGYSLVVVDTQACSLVELLGSWNLHGSRPGKLQRL